MRKTVFITGATGNMGWAGFQELLKKEKFNIGCLRATAKRTVASWLHTCPALM